MHFVSLNTFGEEQVTHPHIESLEHVAQEL
jgi:hypothetical protein